MTINPKRPDAIDEMLAQQRRHREDLIAEAIKEWFGERCPEDQPGCACCDAWHQYDELRAKLGLPPTDHQPEERA
jgi:hypothetical protein